MNGKKNLNWIDQHFVFSVIVNQVNLLSIIIADKYGFFKRPLEVYEDAEEILAGSADHCVAFAGYPPRHRRRNGVGTIHLHTFLIKDETRKTFRNNSQYHIRTCRYFLADEKSLPATGHRSCIGDRIDEQLPF
jgi:hypothetical protein